MSSNVRYQRTVHSRHMQAEPLRETLPDKGTAKCDHAFINTSLKLLEFAEHTLMFASVFNLPRISKLLHQLIFTVEMLLGVFMQFLEQGRKIRIAGGIQLV
jgi:hypothetical protein